MFAVKTISISLVAKLGKFFKAIWSGCLVADGRRQMLCWRQW